MSFRGARRRRRERFEKKFVAKEGDSRDWGVVILWLWLLWLFFGGWQ